jgi:hypothetical protein
MPDMPPFLYASLAMFAAWAVVLFLSKRTRHEQVLMSVIGLVLAPGAIAVASVDYRNVGAAGAVGLEDLLFAFSVFGIASVVYQFVLGKHTKRLRGARILIPHPAAHWLAHLIIALGIWAVIALSLNVILGLSTVQAVIVGGMLVGTYVIADRKDLLFDALLSGLFVSVLVFAAEQLFFVRLFPEAAAQYWQTANLSGLALSGVPVEEILWAGVVGFAIGPLYEYMRDLRVK